MRIVVCEEPAIRAQQAADLVTRFVSGSGSGSGSRALGLATGKTTEELYRELVSRYQRGKVSFRGVTAFLLDEYIGLNNGDPNNFRSVVCHSFTTHVDIGSDSLSSPNPQASDLSSECVRYERKVRTASIGLQILGIGSNGHVAFNEPGSSFDSVTRVVDLSDQTQADNAHFFPANQIIPTQAITQGIATILAAEELLLMACGAAKADAIAQTIEGPVTNSVPASALQLHPKVTVLLDKEAAKNLNRN